MKKSLIALLSLAAFAMIANAERADRGDLDGVSADDLRAKAVCPAKAECPAAPAAKAACPVAKPAAACPAAKPATCPAAKAECPAAAAAECPAQQACCPYLKDLVFLPGILSPAQEAAYVSDFGRNWVSIGGGAGAVFFKENGVKSQKLSAIGSLEASVCAFRAADDSYGLNLTVPLEFKYISYTSNVDIYGFEFPLVANPYYRFVINENLIITPFGTFGAGGSYEYASMEHQSSKSLAFLWELGGGVEVSFLKDFSLSPYYKWANSEDGGSEYFQRVGCQFEWRFMQNVAFVADYSFDFYKKANMTAQYGVLKVRYEF